MMLAQEIDSMSFKLPFNFRPKMMFSLMSIFEFAYKEGFLNGLGGMAGLRALLEKMGLSKEINGSLEKEMFSALAQKYETKSGNICWLLGAGKLVLKIQDELEYLQLKPFNIAVCATMSAGKSTLVNALLGADILPSRNEATTAKITSIYDRDGLDLFRGISQRKSSGEIAFNLRGNELDAWNSHKTIDRIFLEGDLDGIKNTKKFFVAIHDTPGTNNSQDGKHHKLTMDFLKNEKLDALIYVANFEHLMTDDETALLKEIANLKGGVPVIFALNKIDSCDGEKENCEKMIREFRQYVKELGFKKNIHICPVAAKPARLFKMALKNRGNAFTEKEQDDFGLLFRRFKRERVNANNLSEKPAILQDVPTYLHPDVKKISLDEEYAVLELRQALLNTGLIALEKAIENIIISKK